MSFSADWLALREPADHAARNAGLSAALGRHLATRRQPFTAVDLGCGTGSNLRALAPLLPAIQHWRLVDNDAALLARARDALVLWADAVRPVDATRPGDDVLTLRRGDLLLTVAFHRRDLAADLEGALGTSPDLVTAAALFDLVSRPAIERLAKAVARRRAAFLTVLTYDGREEWAPPHSADDAVQAAFLRHLRQDKGFGPATGDGATTALADAFVSAGYAVRTAQSPWNLGPNEAALRYALAAGKADAVAETGSVPASDLASWRASRLRDGTAVIGHADLLALPP